MVVLITGGIGSGKSVVSSILRANGYEVYDCDRKARRLMDSDAGMRRRLSNEVCADAIDGSGMIDRRKIASVVFSNPEKLAILNSIVHGAVKADILRHAQDNPLLFVETAIPVTGGLVELAEAVWQIEAPEQLRISRVMARNNVTAEEVKSRIEAQVSECVSASVTIVNDDTTPLLPQVLDALAVLNLSGVEASLPPR